MSGAVAVEVAWGVERVPPIVSLNQVEAELKNALASVEATLLRWNTANTRIAIFELKQALEQIHEEQCQWTELVCTKCLEFQYIPSSIKQFQGPCQSCQAMISYQASCTSVLGMSKKCKTL